MSSSDKISSESNSDGRYQSDDDGELNLDFKKLFFGEALGDVGEDGDAGMALVRQEVALENLFFERDNQTTQKKPLPQDVAQNSSDSGDEV